MTIKMIRDLANQYRKLPEKRIVILRQIYINSGTPGIKFFAKLLGSESYYPYIRCMKNDIINSRKSRRGEKLLSCVPPVPPKQLREEFFIKELFKELQNLSNNNTGYKVSKAGGRKSAYNGLTWDAKCGGSR